MGKRPGLPSDGHLCPALGLSGILVILAIPLAAQSQPGRAEPHRSLRPGLAIEFQAAADPAALFPLPSGFRWTFVSSRGEPLFLETAAEADGGLRLNAHGGSFLWTHDALLQQRDGALWHEPECGQTAPLMWLPDNPGAELSWESGDEGFTFRATVERQEELRVRAGDFGLGSHAHPARLPQGIPRP
jgi:hypothetical protein